MTAERSSAPDCLSPGLLDRVARRYAPCGEAARRYVAGKLLRDPVHADVLALASREAFGAVLDAGCGRGQLGVALLEAGLARSVLGLDRSEPHLGQARQAGSGLAFAARRQDFATVRQLPEADTVLLVDVLYQLDPASQAALLAAAARAAGRLVVVRTLDPGRGLRSAITLVFEQVARFFSPHSGLHVRPLPVASLSKVLDEAGFAVAVAPCWRGTPFANVLLTARRRD